MADRSPSSRAKFFENALQPNQLDLVKMRELATMGIPEENSLRSTYWKVLLNYLSPDKSEWKQHLDSSRQLYKGFVKDLIVDPHNEQAAQAAESIDHPLSTSNDSKWKEYFKDKHMMGEIDKDVRRTFPHLHFFNENDDKGRRALRQILFIYAKLNPGINYVQGMNEILGPIYYLFAIDQDKEVVEYAEEDAFFCFTNLMSEIMNNFCKTLDTSSMGIHHLMKRYDALLKIVDRDLWENLKSKQLSAEFYSFRWLTLLLSQEFELPDVMRLWDTLFSDPKRFDLVLYVCCSMVVHIRGELTRNDFAENLKLLQDYPKSADVNQIIKTAKNIQKRYPRF